MSNVGNLELKCLSFLVTFYLMCTYSTLTVHKTMCKNICICCTDLSYVKKECVLISTSKYKGDCYICNLRHYIVVYFRQIDLWADRQTGRQIDK